MRAPAVFHMGLDCIMASKLPSSEGTNRKIIVQTPLAEGPKNMNLH